MLNINTLAPHFYLIKKFSVAIEELPLANSPEVFGLHPNAEIGYYTLAVRDMWSHLIQLQPQTGTQVFLISFSPPGTTF